MMDHQGTNRSSFFRGEVAKYGWVDIGSSFLPSDIIAACLYAQLECSDMIQSRRKEIWNRYFDNLTTILANTDISLPVIADYSTNNAHMFYLVCKDLEQRTHFIKHLKDNGVYAVFHYLSLHKSEYYNDKYVGYDLKNADSFTDSLVRLPLFYDLTNDNIDYIVDVIKDYIT